MLVKVAPGGYATNQGLKTGTNIFDMAISL